VSSLSAPDQSSSHWSMVIVVSPHMSTVKTNSRRTKRRTADCKRINKVSSPTERNDSWPAIAKVYLDRETSGGLRGGVYPWGLGRGKVCVSGWLIVSIWRHQLEWGIFREFSTWASVRAG